MCPADLRSGGGVCCFLAVVQRFSILGVRVPPSALSLFLHIPSALLRPAFLFRATNTNCRTSGALLRFGSSAAAARVPRLLPQQRHQKGTSGGNKVHGAFSKVINSSDNGCFSEIQANSSGVAASP